MLLALGGSLQIFRKIAVAKLANKRLVAYQGPGVDVGDASPWVQIYRGMYPPNAFMSQNWASAQVMTFFWPSLHFGQKIGIWERYDLFFGLHFIVGKKLDICRRVNLAKSSPPNI